MIFAVQEILFLFWRSRLAAISRQFTVCCLLLILTDICSVIHGQSKGTMTVEGCVYEEGRSKADENGKFRFVWVWVSGRGPSLGKEYKGLMTPEFAQTVLNKPLPSHVSNPRVDGPGAIGGIIWLNDTDVRMTLKIGAAKNQPNVVKLEVLKEHKGCPVK